MISRYEAGQVASEKHNWQSIGTLGVFPFFETALQAKAPEKNRLITADPTSLEKPVIPDA